MNIWKDEKGEGSFVSPTLFSTAAFFACCSLPVWRCCFSHLSVDTCWVFFKKDYLWGNPRDHKGHVTKPVRSVSVLMSLSQTWMNLGNTGVVLDRFLDNDRSASTEGIEYPLKSILGVTFCCFDFSHPPMGRENAQGNACFMLWWHVRRMGTPRKFVLDK